MSGPCLWACAQRLARDLRSADIRAEMDAGIFKKRCVGAGEWGHCLTTDAFEKPVPGAQERFRAWMRNLESRSEASGHAVGVWRSRGQRTRGRRNAESQGWGLGGKAAERVVMQPSVASNVDLEDGDVSDGKAVARPIEDGGADFALCENDRRGQFQVMTQS